MLVKMHVSEMLCLLSRLGKGSAATGCVHVLNRKHHCS